MRFECDNCGCRLSVPAARAGKRGRCPKCKHIVTVPDGQDDTISSKPPAVPADEPDQTPPLHDVTLLDVSPAQVAARPPLQPEEDPEAVLERLRTMQGGRLPGEDEPPPQRKLPWMIDIFFYPMNKEGLSLLFICAGVPFLLRVILKFFRVFSAVFGPALIFWVLFIIVHWLGMLLLLLYVNWYACECIRDSAAGGIRAVDTIATTPGLGEILGQAFRVAVCALFVVAPALVYLARTHRTDLPFQLLYAAGGFVFPMALLAVVMFDSFAGLNPILLLRSILKTHLRYCFLIPFYYLFWVLIPAAGVLLFQSWMLGYLSLFLAFYSLLILAHLLGRFYWKNEQRLDWDA